ncbi:hypothetical protein I2484_10825 [Sporosarcina sp. E16_8]|nr:hypothetical protein [Sporosarcina sp. E16_8]
MAYAVRREYIWIDDTIVSINGVKLDMRIDVYDYRKQ